MMYARALVVGLGAALGACQPDFVHVLVESSTPELEFAPVHVNVAVYGGGSGKETVYDGRFLEPEGNEATLPYTDFNLVLEDAPHQPIDLRVAVADTPTLWAGDRLIEPPGDGRAIHMLLYAGERSLGAVRIGDGELTSLARFSNGLATAWPSANGVELRTDRVPDEPLGRAELLLPADTGSSKVRIASRPTDNIFGPDLMMVSWLGSDDHAWMLLQDETARQPSLQLRGADDVWGAVAPTSNDFEVASLIVDGQHLWFGWYDGAGALMGEVDRKPPGMLRRARGLVVGKMGYMVAAVETDQGWFLMHVTDEAGRVTHDPVMIGEVAAIGQSSDQVFVLTVQRVDDQVIVQAYYATTLGAFGDPVAIADAERVPAGVFGRIGVSSCAVAWPEKRDDGGTVIDVRVQDLDPDGQPVRPSRLINGELSQYHFAPTLACMSQTVTSATSLAYATFVQADSNGSTGGLKLRKLPPAPEP